jgi:hypothetical protein
MEFTKKELAFLEAEFGYEANDLENMSKESLCEVQDKCFVIEEVETVAAIKDADGDLSERGELAASIVTKIGNGFSDKGDGE